MDILPKCYNKSMKKIKAFIYVFYKSLTSLDYYKDLLKVTVGFSINYLLVLAIIGTIFTTLSLSGNVLPEVKSWTRTFLHEFKNIYPKDLEITVQDNKWSLNKPEPYEIPVPKSLLKTMEESAKPEDFKEKGAFPKNLFVFDKNGTIDQLEKNNTLILVNENNFITQGKNKIEIYPLKDIPNGKLDQQVFNTFIDKLNQIFSYLPAIVITFIIIFSFIFQFVFRLGYLIIVAALLWIISKIMKSKLGFGELFRISIHTMTLPLVLDIVLTKVFTFEIPFTWWFLVVNTTFSIIVISYLLQENKPKVARVVVGTTKKVVDKPKVIKAVKKPTKPKTSKKK